MELRGDRNKTLKISRHEGHPYFWITGPNGGGWSIVLGGSASHPAINPGVHAGHSEHGMPRLMTVEELGGETKIRIHHPTSGSGKSIKVGTEQFRQAIARQ